MSVFFHLWMTTRREECQDFSNCCTIHSSKSLHKASLWISKWSVNQFGRKNKTGVAPSKKHYNFTFIFFLSDSLKRLWSLSVLKTQFETNKFGTWDSSILCLYCIKIDALFFLQMVKQSKLLNITIQSCTHNYLLTQIFVNITKVAMYNRCYSQCI